MSLSQFDGNLLPGLLSRMFDGDLTDNEFDQLAEMLEADGAARKFYLNFVGFDTELSNRLSSRLTKPLPTGVATKQAPFDFSELESLDLSSMVAESLNVHAAESARSKPAIALPASPILRFAGSTRKLLRSPLVWSIAVVALCLYGTFGLVAWNLRPQKLANEFGGNDTPTAIVQDVTDAKWPAGIIPKQANSPIQIGERLKIDSGTVEFTLPLGVTLLVEGPTEWTIDGEVATLKAGTMIANVPSQAVGFTLSTPTAEIVDLGTEFGVEVNESGATEVQVLKGKVELHAGKQGTATSAPKPITLSAGSARRVEFDKAKGAVVIQNVAPSAQFSARRSSLSKSYQLSAGALASSEGAREYGRAANHLVNGSGLSDGAHTNIADGTMWHSAYGKVQGEFVLFDLFRPCRIESMKIWNYNENVHPEDGHVTNMHEQRGVAQADIYVSTTGQGDPISRPHDWKLIVEKRHFAMADGTAKYSSPDLISLGNVEARFVAIVIESRHHPELVSPGVVCVGLSEVQFFGERVPAKESLKRN